MFLEVASSNNDPKIIAGYFLKCVKEVGGCPRLIQTDCKGILQRNSLQKPTDWKKALEVYFRLTTLDEM